jgi:uncharacterized protein
VSIDPRIVLAGLIVGVLVGLTGAGGGALMTPILVLLFGVTPSAAVSSDIVASAIMKPFGGFIHFRRGTVDFGLVLWLSIGSVPAAFAGVFIDHSLGAGKVMQQRIEYAMGAALLVASAAMVARMVAGGARGRDVQGDEGRVHVKRVLTIAIGAVCGLLVGITSVGAGSLVIVMLMFAYPRLSMRRLVGTDIVQSMPLVGSAAIGHALFGNLQFGLTAAIAIGSIPGVIAGALLSSRSPDRVLRPVIAVVLTATAVKLLGASNIAVAITVAVLVAVGLPLWALADGLGHSAEAWRAAGYRKRATLALATAGIPVGVGLVTALAYFARIRPRVASASVQHRAELARQPA